MKALTLTQPWASLVTAGAKTVETRSWPTRYRGRLAIHAARAFPGYACEFAEDLGIDPRSLPRGAVLGTVEIVDCSPTGRVLLMVGDKEIELGNYQDGRWAWILRDPVTLPEPVPARGALGLWNWEPPS